LSFTILKKDAAKTHGKSFAVNGYPNKPVELIANSGFIFRSDSNSEDLPGFAGAGLFDSYAIEDEIERRVQYSSDRLMAEAEFRSEFMNKVGSIGEVIEQIYEGVAQDIEGCLGVDQKYYVV